MLAERAHNFRICRIRKIQINPYSTQSPAASVSRGQGDDLLRLKGAVALVLETLYYLRSKKNPDLVSPGWRIVPRFFLYAWQALLAGLRHGELASGGQNLMVMPMMLHSAQNCWVTYLPSPIWGRSTELCRRCRNIFDNMYLQGSNPSNNQKSSRAFLWGFVIQGNLRGL